MNREEIKSVKKEYLPGKKIILLYLNDRYSKLAPGETGIISHVDDIGQIHVNWESGSSLALIPEVDEFEIIDEEVVLNEVIYKE